MVLMSVDNPDEIVSHDERGIPMGNDNVRHVVPNSDGGWDVKAPHAQRASAHEDTKAAATARARAIVENAGGGQVIPHNKDGRISNPNTIAPGNDPFPPRDKKR
jgi:hypothetical protein